MKIVLVSVSGNSSLSGVSRHISNVARCLLLRPEVSEVHVIAAPWENSWIMDAIGCVDSRIHLHSVGVSSSRVMRNLWFYFDLPAIAEQLRADVVHLSYPAPLNKKRFHCPVVVTLHDFYPYTIPENFGFPKVHLNRLILRQCLESADAIACVSKDTRQGLDEWMPSHIGSKAVTIYNSVGRTSAAPAPVAVPGWNGEPFLLCVAQHRRNKNVILALQVFRNLLREGLIVPDTLFLIVGVSGPETPAIYRFLRDEGLEHRVVLLSGLSEAEMQWCYRRCELLLCPSILEGFGLPVAEGLLAGSRVVCSDIPSLRELGGEACCYVPLGAAAVDAFVRAAAATMKAPRGAQVRFPSLSPTVIAGEYLKLYRKLISAAGQIRPRQSTARVPAHKVVP